MNVSKVESNALRIANVKIARIMRTNLEAKEIAVLKPKNIIQLEKEQVHMQVV